MEPMSMSEKAIAFVPLLSGSPVALVKAVTAGICITKAMNRPLAAH